MGKRGEAGCLAQRAVFARMVVERLDAVQPCRLKGEDIRCRWQGSWLQKGYFMFQHASHIPILSYADPVKVLCPGHFLSADTYSLFVVSISVQILLLHLHLLVEIEKPTAPSGATCCERRPEA